MSKITLNSILWAGVVVVVVVGGVCEVVGGLLQIISKCSVYSVTFSKKIT